MKQLYSEEETRRRSARVKTAKIIALAVGAVALAACVALCFGVRTKNAAERQWITVGVSCLGGWVAILLLDLLIIPQGRQAAHEEGILRDGAAQRETFEGTVVSVGALRRIPRSAAFYPVTVANPAGEEMQLKLNPEKAKGFPAAGSAIRGVTSRKYITAYGGSGDEA